MCELIKSKSVYLYSHCQATDQPGLYILDCLFSVLVIGALVVFVWRGVWILCDLCIYPDNVIQSSWASMVSFSVHIQPTQNCITNPHHPQTARPSHTRPQVIGYAIVAASFCMQSTMRWLCEQLTGLPRLLAADLFLAFSFVGTVNVWRGVWNLCDIYFIPSE